MPNRARPRQSHQPLTQEEYDDRCECRCPAIEGTHIRLHCEMERAENGGATR
jgi:hypothetical protein